MLVCGIFAASVQAVVIFLNKPEDSLETELWLCQNQSYCFQSNY